MKKKWIVVAFAACAIALTSCNVFSEPESIAVESVTLDATTLTLALGATRKLTATIKPDNADDKTVVWSSSDTAVVMVDNDGTVGAIKTGTATITAKSADKQATCTVTVSEIAVVNPDSSVAVESVMLNTTTLTIEPGKMRTLTATVTPSNAEDKIVTWSSSDEKVATVSDDGTVTAYAEGTVTITAKAGGKEATCTVAVKPILIAVKSVSLNMTILTLTSGETGKLTATVTPSDADDSTVAWSSSNADVATVGNDGTVTAVSIGTVVITARAGDKWATCTVTVKQILIAVERVLLDRETLTLTRGETEKLTATVTPSNADDTSVAWSSSDADVATVVDGTVIARKAGTAVITAQAGGRMAICAVNVNPILVESVTLYKTTLTLAPGMTGKLTAIVKPDNADDKTVKWSSSNTSVAMVDNDGTIGAFKTGETTITAQSGSIKAECKVTVHVHSYSGGKCTVCGVVPYLKGGIIDEHGVLVRYSGSETTVVIPDGVTGIGYPAFSNCTGLTSVEIPASVTSIGYCAFEGCTGLTEVKIPDGVTKIGNYAFSMCTGLTSVTIPGSVTDIWGGAFSGCTGLASVTISDGVTSITDYAFDGCTSLTEVTIPNSVTGIGGRAFYGCTGLTEVTIPNSVTSIGFYAFYGCTGLTEVTIPDGVTSIESNAFEGCTSLTNVTIPNSLTRIGFYAFYGCTGLTEVTIPNSVMYIENYAFGGCTSLTSISFLGTKADWEKISRSTGAGLSGKTITGSDGSTWKAY